MLWSGASAFERTMRTLQRLSRVALLATLVLLFGFQDDRSSASRSFIAILAVPIAISGLFERGPCVLGQPTFRRRLMRCRGNEPVRSRIRGGARNRCRRPRRGSGDAVAAYALDRDS